MDQTLTLIVGIAIGALFCLIVCYLYILNLKLKQEKEILQKVKETRKDSTKRQRAIIKGDVSERVVPFLTEKTGCLATELKHLGSPIDWIGFQGIDDDPKNKEITIKLFEVKTGKRISWDSKGREKAIRDAVREGRVEWELIKINPKEVNEFFDKNLDIEFKQD